MTGETLLFVAAEERKRWKGGGERGEEGEPLDALGARPQSRLAPRLIRIRTVRPDQPASARPGVHLPRARLQTSCANPLA